MKKIILSTLLAGTCFSLLAQPTLTSANNPVAGEKYYGRYLDTDGLDKGAAGSDVTWNFAAVTVNDSDTTSYFNCAATPYCDSFSGSNLAMYDGYDYYYGITGTDGVKFIGGTNSGAIERFSKPWRIVFYPMTYNTFHIDTAAATDTVSGVPLYLTIYDSSLCDAFGTVVLPTGTFSNALRVHTVEIFKDSANVLGMPIVNQSRTDIYKWYVAGFHTELVSISYDTSGATAPYMSEAKYNWHVVPVTAVGGVSANASGLTLYPNPASNAINANFDLTDNASEIVITDLMGRVVKYINTTDLKAGRNELAIPVADMAEGMYVFQLRTASGVVSQKISVKK